MQKTTLSEVNVMDLLANAPSLITVNKNTTVQDTLKLLFDTGVLCVPVADQNIHAYPKHIAGFIDLLDILAYLVHVCEAYSLSYSTPSALAAHFMSKQVGDLLDYSARDRFKAVLEEDDLLSVMEVLGKPGTHRVAVLNVLNDIQNLVAQSDIVRLLANNIHLLGSHADTPIKDLRFVHDLVLVHAAENALSAFKRMNDMRISAAPVVDNNGVYISTLSVSDLKGLTEESFSLLTGSTQAFAEKHQYLMKVPLVCAPTDTLRKVLTDLAQTQGNKHRVWVLDNNGKPVGVVTETDVCRVVHQLIASPTQSS